MPDRPIIFSAPMIRALLDGRKTQTRRVLRPQPYGFAGNFWIADKHSGACRLDDWAEGRAGCLPYFPGDRLWVKEAHVLTPAGVAYVADGVDHYGAGGALRKRPSIHMPRWASRLTLTVTEVRVQRLQDISEADAVAEGIDDESPLYGRAEHVIAAGAPWGPFRLAFAGLWNDIHGPDAWDANPWVAAISFTVQRENIDQIGGAG